MAAGAVASVLGGVIAAAPAIASSDPGACAPNGRVSIDGPEYVCSLWTGHVPVYDQAIDTANVVGYLNYGGRANWFTTQCLGTETFIGNAYNNWWALTEADNGHWGFVPLTYFSGGANNQASSVLPVVPGWGCR